MKRCHPRPLGHWSRQASLKFHYRYYRCGYEVMWSEGEEQSFCEFDGLPLLPRPHRSMGLEERSYYRSPVRCHPYVEKVRIYICMRRLAITTEHHARLSSTSLICSSIAMYSSPFCRKVINAPGGISVCAVLDLMTSDSYANVNAE